MKNKMAFLLVLSVIALSLAACGKGVPAVTEGKVTIDPVPLPADGEYIGTANADKYYEGGGTVAVSYPEFYHWTSNEFGPDCVIVGNMTKSIVFHSQEGYYWEQKGDEYCLKEKKN